MKKYMLVIGFLCSIAFLPSAILNAMDVGHQRLRRELGTEIIWVKTVDGTLVKVPYWQIEQMGKLHKFYLLHTRYKGYNSAKNPLLSLGLATEQLILLQEALNIADNSELLKNFYSNLTDEHQHDLLEAANKVEAAGLTALLLPFIFPKELQSEIYSPGIISSVVSFLKRQSKRKYHLNGKESVYCGAFSPDSRYIVSGGDDNQLVVWDTKTGNKIETLIASSLRPATILAVAWSPDGACFVSGSSDYEDNLIVWDTATWDIKTTLVGTHGSVRCTTFTIDGRYIISGSDDHNLALWDAQKLALVDMLPGHQGSVLCVGCSPDGQYMVSGSDDHNLIVWDSKTWQPIKTLSAHEGKVTCLAFSRNGKYMVSGSVDRHFIIWDTKTWEQIKISRKHKADITAVAFGPNDDSIVVGTSRELCSWDIKTWNLKTTLSTKGHAITFIALSFDKHYWIIGMETNGIEFMETTDQKIINFIEKGLTLTQARFIYRLYLSKIKNMAMVIDEADTDYVGYLLLPDAVKEVINLYFPFKTAPIAIQEERAQLEPKLFEEKTMLRNIYESLIGASSLTIDEKIENVLRAMENEADKHSVRYRALKKILVDLKAEKKLEKVK